MKLRVSCHANLGALLLAATVGLLVSRGAALREDELQCEEAAAHLEDCCPALDVGQIDCVYHEGCGSPSRPVLSPEAARCIRYLECDSLRRSGWCEPDRYSPSAVDGQIRSCP